MAKKNEMEVPKVPEVPKMTFDEWVSHHENIKKYLENRKIEVEIEKLRAEEVKIIEESSSIKTKNSNETKYQQGYSIMVLDSILRGGDEFIVKTDSIYTDKEIKAIKSKMFEIMKKL